MYATVTRLKPQSRIYEPVHTNQKSCVQEIYINPIWADSFWGCRLISKVSIHVSNADFSNINGIQQTPKSRGYTIPVYHNTRPTARNLHGQQWHIFCAMYFTLTALCRDFERVTNPSKPSDAYMHKWNMPSLAQIMACRPFGTEPLSVSMLFVIFIWNSKSFLKLPHYLGLSVLKLISRLCRIYASVN